MPKRYVEWVARASLLYENVRQNETTRETRSHLDDDVVDFGFQRRVAVV